MLALVDRFSSPDTRFDPEQIADRQRLERADFVDAVLGLAGRLAAALDYAHDRGVLHLDVKPENVLITPYGRPMLMDFNVSLSRHDGTAANPELFGGTFDFMAPEHLEAFHQRERGEAMKRLDPRADVFSLGALMRSALGKVTQPENDEVAGLATLLDRSTAPDRDRRFVSAAALGKAVGSYVELRGVRRSIVERGLISSFSTHFPVDFLAFFGAFLALQLLIVGVAFENLFLVNLLEGPAREAFHRFNVVEMPLTVLFGYLLWLGYVGCFRGPLRRAESYIDDAPQRAAYRRRMLRLPIAALFAWLPSLILAATFPWRQTVAVDPYGLRVFAGYLLPFTSIWVLTLACLALYAEFTCVRLMYPKFFFGEVEIRATAARELRSMPAVLFGFCAITIVLPLVSGALTLVFYSSSNMDIIGFRTSFYHLTFCFLGPLIGFLVAASSVRRYIQAYFALTGNGGLSLGRMI